MSRKFIVFALTATLLTGCAEPGGPGVMHGGSMNKSDVGTALGAVGGGIIGYQFGGGAGQALATVGGALLGGMLGNAVGTSMDNTDRLVYDRYSQRAMETGRRETWRNPDTGNYGTIHPGKRYTNDYDQLCREYTQTIYVGGQKHTGYGTACRADDGSWQIVD